MAGRGRQRTSFGKRERERKRQEKQAAKRARRQHNSGQPSVKAADGGEAVIHETDTTVARMNSSDPWR
jgi:hypothetical protein